MQEKDSQDAMVGKIISTTPVGENGPPEEQLMILSENDAKQQDKQPPRPVKIIDLEK